MPEMWFKVQWPDGTASVCYSPSTVIEDYFAKGQRYTVRAFLEAARPALDAAARRVEARYGYRCSSADDQLNTIEEMVAKIGVETPGEVTILYVGRTPP
jgi:uncharacterized repeat protein (TIGR04042 family)